MVTDRETGLRPPVPARPADASAAAGVVVGPVRGLLSLATGLVGFLLVAALFAQSSWSWLLWIVVGLAAGAVAARARLVWIGWVSVALFYPVGGWLGLITNLGPFWLLGALIGAVLVTIGFLPGTAIGLRHSPWAAARVAWRGLAGIARRLIIGALVVGLVGLAGYTGYVGIVGSEEFVHPAVKWPECGNPTTRYGWDYEAINYDKADDLRLAADNPDMTNCTTQGSVAGTEVVSSDGVHVAGWYIPAANASVAADGPTIVVVPGWKSNKSEILKYAPPLHDAYNLVLVDVRNGGRSSPADTTLGLREQLDVRAVIDWLVRTKDPGWIALLGNSMGAATSLAEAVSDQRVEALILDSMHAELIVSAGNVLETEHGHPAFPGSVAIIAAASLRVGADVTSIDPVRTITQVGDRPVLLIHSTTDVIDRPAESAELNFHAALDAGVAVELHYCPGAVHGKAIDRCPADWSRWANEFLAAAMGPQR
jgi:pimeloyl-ACP methyl ester carboxylesterase